MTRKNPLSLALFLALLLCVPLSAGTWQEWYVDNSWTGETHGTLEAPFTNIQATIDFVVSTSGMWSADTILVKDTGVPYEGALMFPNMNAMRLMGYDGCPVIKYSGAEGASTIMSGTNYLNPNFACMPPAQVGLENLRIENLTTAPGDWYCADIQTWVSWEPDRTPDQYRFGVSNCVFYGGGVNSGVKLRDLDQRHMPSMFPPGIHTSLVQNCTFTECGTGVKVMSMQSAKILNNWFVSNGVGVTAVETTNAVYLRTYSNIVVCFNVFAWGGKDVIEGGIYPRLFYYNNTFYENAGTGVLFNAGVQELPGTGQLHNNLFYGNLAAWVANAGDTNRLIANNNLYYTNAIATGWESFGTSNVFDDPLLVLDSADEYFLYLDPSSPAADRPAGYGGATFIGALPPIPEAFSMGAVLFACALALRRCGGCSRGRTE